MMRRRLSIDPWVGVPCRLPTPIISVLQSCLPRLPPSLCPPSNMAAMLSSFQDANYASPYAQQVSAVVVVAETESSGRAVASLR